MARLLITGGAGFIGANYVRHRRRAYPDDVIVVLDALTYAGDRAKLDGVDDLIFVHGDIRDYPLVLSLMTDHRLDTVVHFAAETHVDRSIDGPDIFIDSNIGGTHVLLKAAKAVWLRGAGQPHRFHHISTDEVYGSLGADDAPASEASALAPNSPYSASKAAADHLVRAYNRTFGLQTTITRCSNNYGPYQFPEKLIPLFLSNILMGRPLPIYGDGGNTRDWLHVADHCCAIDLALEKGRAGEIYNIAGGAELANLALIDLLCAAVDNAFAKDPRLAEKFITAPPAQGRPAAALKTFVADRPGHDRRYAIDASKARREFGYATSYDFRRGLIGTVDWYLSRWA